MYSEWVSFCTIPPSHPDYAKKTKPKTKSKAIHVYIFNDGSRNDKEIEVVDQSTVQTLGLWFVNSSLWCPHWKTTLSETNLLQSLSQFHYHLSLSVVFFYFMNSS